MELLGIGLVGWMAIGGAILGAANAITMITPTKVDNEILQKIVTFVNTIAGNIGRNKNADAPK